MRARRMSATLWVTNSGLRGSAINPARVLAIPMLRSAAASRSTPPSYVIRPPSKAAVTFLRPTDGESERQEHIFGHGGCGSRGYVAELVSTPNL